MASQVIQFQSKFIGKAHMPAVSKFLEKNFPDGTIEPKRLVDLARPRTSPIHRYFVWDDTKAAEEYRLSQARYLIRSIEIKVNFNDHDNIRAFINVSVDKDRRYVSNEVISGNDAFKEIVIGGIRKELVALRRKYLVYEKHFSSVFNEIKKLETTTTEETNGKEESNRPARRNTRAQETKNIGRRKNNNRSTDDKGRDNLASR